MQPSSGRCPREIGEAEKKGGRRSFPRDGDEEKRFFRSSICQGLKNVAIQYVTEKKQRRQLTSSFLFGHSTVFRESETPAEKKKAE